MSQSDQIRVNYDDKKTIELLNNDEQKKKPLPHVRECTRAGDGAEGDGPRHLIESSRAVDCPAVASNFFLFRCKEIIIRDLFVLGNGPLSQHHDLLAARTLDDVGLAVGLQQE